MDAAIGDAQVGSLSGTKISASTSVAIGSATWGADGIQLQYNSGNPRFYAGDGGYNYFTFDGSGITINSGSSDGQVKISGGVISIKSATFGAQGIQLDYNSGTPRFYVGDGSNNFLNFDGTNVSLSSSKSDALVIRNGGAIVINDTNNSASLKIKPYSTYACEITPDTDNSDALWIGGASSLWTNLTMQARTSVTLSCIPTSGSTSGMGLYSSYGYISVTTSSSTKTLTWNQALYDGTTYRGQLYPNDHKVSMCGLSGSAWYLVYADDFTNVADFFYMDDRDDIALLHQIKGSGIICQKTGIELIDDDTLPNALLIKDGHGNPERDPDNKPYISYRTLLSLIMGACRQLDKKIEKIRTDVDAIKAKE
jgi:hypothetical protein